MNKKVEFVHYDKTKTKKKKDLGTKRIQSEFFQ